MRITKPSLTRVLQGGVAAWIDDELLARHGVLVAFSERSGGVSEGPYSSLNLAGHVGDDPAAVDHNRLAFLEALGIGAYGSALTMAEQVHGDKIARVQGDPVGSGARASGGKAPIGATDALVTATPDLPLALCFADCVPVILVAPGPAVAVVHAGWRGALSSLPGKSVEDVSSLAACAPSEVTAYIGPHIRACHYEVSDEVMSQFFNTFGTFARAVSGGLDLDAVVSASLERAGVAPCNIARLGTCTAETTDRFFSYRAEAGNTGRHAALACILSRD